MPYAEDAHLPENIGYYDFHESTDHLQMPELITSQYEVQLSEEEEKRYEELKADFILELPEGEITLPMPLLLPVSSLSWPMVPFMMMTAISSSSMIGSWMP